MTEPEEASSEVANKSRETPTMNALASIVQSVVEEMKAMNRRMDHLSKPINLEDKEIDYEEGELEHGDADRELVVSLDKKVNELTKAPRQEQKIQRALVLFDSESWSEWENWEHCGWGTGQHCE